MLLLVFVVFVVPMALSCEVGGVGGVVVVVAGEASDVLPRGEAEGKLDSASVSGFRGAPGTDRCAASSPSRRCAWEHSSVPTGSEDRVVSHNFSKARNPPSFCTTVKHQSRCRLWRPVVARGGWGSQRSDATAPLRPMPATSALLAGEGRKGGADDDVDDCDGGKGEEEDRVRVRRLFLVRELPSCGSAMDGEDSGDEGGDDDDGGGGMRSKAWSALTDASWSGGRPQLSSARSRCRK